MLRVGPGRREQSSRAECHHTPPSFGGSRASTVWKIGKMNSVGTRKEDGLGADASQPEPLHSRGGQVSASDCGWTAASPSCRGARRSPAAASDRAKSLTDTAHQSRIGAPPRRTERRDEGKPRRRPRSRRGDPTGRRGSFLSPPSTAPTAHDSVLRPHIRRITHASSCSLHTPLLTAFVTSEALLRGAQLSRSGSATS